MGLKDITRKLDSIYIDNNLPFISTKVILIEPFIGAKNGTWFIEPWSFLIIFIQRNR